MKTWDLLELNLNECKVHIDRALGALKALENNSYDPSTRLAFEDQFIYRFTKLQDKLSKGVITPFCSLIFSENASFLDSLYLLEKERLLRTSDFLKLRALRNSLSHEYEGTKEDFKERFCILKEGFFDLVDIYENIEAKFKELKRL